jgi:hypothetical protein
MNKGMRLFAMLPFGMVSYYAEQQNLSCIDLCCNVATKNGDWVARLFDEDLTFSMEDLKHDFVGLMQDDLYFEPRI